MTILSYPHGTISEADRCGNSDRPLTRRSDSAGRGLAVKATQSCSVATCDKPGESRGWCNTHYERWRLWGDVRADVGTTDVLGSAKRQRYVRKPCDLDLDRLTMAPEDVARLTRPEREKRVYDLIDEAHELVAHAKDLYIRSDDKSIRSDDKSIRAVVILFSGGNDSTVLAHLFRDTATHAAHANTGVGIEQTREYVRATCERWNLPLMERKAPRAQDSYRAQVLEHGFPGPGRHARMFQRLKERALEQVRRELVRYPRRERIVFLAGRSRPAVLEDEGLRMGRHSRHPARADPDSRERRGQR